VASNKQDSSGFHNGRNASSGPPVFPARWALKQIDETLSTRLSDELKVPALLARLLALRGISGAEEAEVFLSAPLTALHDPFLMKGMETAAAHLAREIIKGRPIGIYGDYDTDGISSTTLLVLFFRSLGVPASYFIPRRMEEGYGLHLSGLMTLREAGCETIVTVDTGITAVDVAREAQENGIHLIITDHHGPPEVLPEAVAVINPRQLGCAYPFKGLSGVGVAFKLATAVRRRLRDEGFEGELPNLKQHLDLVALGTVADIVPLLDENHILVRAGLEVISLAANVGSAVDDTYKGKPGIRVLVAAADLKAESITAGHIGFVLAPRLNAAGRVGDPRLGVDLLMEADPALARPRAEKLEIWNRQRQDLEREAHIEALAQVEAMGLTDDHHSLVLASEKWHPGVIGIVASRMVEKFNRPSVLIHLDGEVGKGSCRGVSGVHLVEVLNRCADSLIQFGGHKGAAGLSVKRENVARFREEFENAARDALGGESARPELLLDGVVDFSELEMPLVETLERMAPFGAGNPQPVFASSGVEVVGRPESVGKGKHLKMRIRQRGYVVDSIGFGLGGFLDDEEFLKGKLDVAYNAGVNRWRGSAKIQIQIKALRPAGG
jgi:single-stranded-DNA-specific exonuclease